MEVVEAEEERKRGNRRHYVIAGAEDVLFRLR